MIPITLLGLQKVSALLTTTDALSGALQTLNNQFNLKVPLIRSNDIALSTASAEIGDRNVQLRYPRVCLYSTGVKNSREEKYRAFSGTVSVVAEILASGNLVNDTDEWVHYYVEALTGLLRKKRRRLGGRRVFWRSLRSSDSGSKDWRIRFCSGSEGEFQPFCQSGLKIYG